MKYFDHSLTASFRTSECHSIRNEKTKVYEDTFKAGSVELSSIRFRWDTHMPGRAGVLIKYIPDEGEEVEITLPVSYLREALNLIEHDVNSRN